MQVFFEPRRGWYRSTPACRWTAVGYFRLLRACLRANPTASRELLKKCVDCGVLFLTVAQNSGRSDLRCSFGCRQHHRSQASSLRSSAYYQTAEGRTKKAEQNARRRTASARSESMRADPPVGPAEAPDAEAIFDPPRVAASVHRLCSICLGPKPPSFAYVLQAIDQQWKWILGWMRQHRFDYRGS